MPTGLLDLAEAFKKAIPHWDPAKHPRGRDGQFLEVGDIVRAFDGPGGPQIAIGKVIGSSYDHDTKRLFIGIDTGGGKTEWFRPKQLEGVVVKANLNKEPTLPLPSLEGKPSEVKFDSMTIAPVSEVGLNDAVGEALSTGDVPAYAKPLEKSDLSESFQEKAGLTPSQNQILGPPKTAPAVDTLSPESQVSLTHPTPLVNSFKNDTGSIQIPQGKNAADILALMRVTFDKKLDAGTAPFSKQEYEARFNAILNSTDHNTAWKNLNAMMVSLKLGGRQRKRYREALAVHYGGHQATKVTVKAPAEDFGNLPDAPGVAFQAKNSGYADDPMFKQLGIHNVSDMSKHPQAESLESYGIHKGNDVIAQGPSAYDGSKFDSFHTETIDVPLDQIRYKEGQTHVLHPYVEYLSKTAQEDFVQDDLPYGQRMPDGTVLLMEGHHRAAAASLRGDTSLKMTVYGKWADTSPLGPGDAVPPEDAVKGGKLKPYNDAEIKALGPAKVLGLLKTQFQIQKDAGVHGDLHQMVFDTNFKSMLMAPENLPPQERFDSSMSHLSAIAKQLKLGGRQRARYRAALADFYGHVLPEVEKKPITPGLPKEKVAKVAGPQALKLEKVPKFPFGEAVKQRQEWYAAVSAVHTSGPTSGTSMAKVRNAVWRVGANMSGSKNLDESLKNYQELVDLIPQAKQDILASEPNSPSVSTLDQISSEASARIQEIQSIKKIQDHNAQISLAAPSPYDSHDISTWRKIAGEKAQGQKVPAIGTANKLVQGGGVSPQAAKRNIQDNLAKRMEGKFPPEKLVSLVKDTKYGSGGYLVDLADATNQALSNPESLKGAVLFPAGDGNWRIIASGAGTNAENYPDAISNPTLEQVASALHSSVVNSMVKLWAQTSNDNNVRSLAMQRAAVEEFSLNDVYDWPMADDMQYMVGDEYAKHGDFMRSFLRAMHDNTQEWAKANQITHVRLRRGVKNPPPGTAHIPSGSTLTVQFRPMSSFSSQLSIAKRFGYYQMESIVPVEWIVGTAATGFGCQSEYEWVVLGGTHEAKRL